MAHYITITVRIGLRDRRKDALPFQMLIEPVPTYPCLPEQQILRRVVKKWKAYGYQAGRNSYSQNRIIETSRYPTINCSYYVALTISSYTSKIYCLGKPINYLVFQKTTCNYVFYRTPRQNGKRKVLEKTKAKGSIELCLPKLNLTIQVTYYHIF